MKAHGIRKGPRRFATRASRSGTGPRPNAELKGVIFRMYEISEVQYVGHMHGDRARVARG